VAVDPELPQIVDGPAAGEHQNALLRQGAEGAAEGEVVVGALSRLDRELRHRHVGIRIDQDQRRPGAVIEPARRILAAGEAGGAQQPRRAARQIRRARGGIAQPVELLGEAVEIVDGLGPFGGRDHRLLRLPVCRDAEDRLRPWQILAEPGQEMARRMIFQHQGRRAVRDENGRYPLRHFKSS
jgi:hypothetical protein